MIHELLKVTGCTQREHICALVSLFIYLPRGQLPFSRIFSFGKKPARYNAPFGVAENQLRVTSGSQDTPCWGSIEGSQYTRVAERRVQEARRWQDAWLCARLVGAPTLPRDGGTSRRRSAHTAAPSETMINNIDNKPQSFERVGPRWGGWMQPPQLDPLLTRPDEWGNPRLLNRLNNGH